MDNYFKILFSSVSYTYDSDISQDELNEVIFKKTSKRRTWTSAVNYSVKADLPTNGYHIIRRGYFVPILITVATSTESKTLTLNFKPLINPLFILGPILIFMWPTLSRGFENFASTNNLLLMLFILLLFVLTITCLFTYIPISKEKKTIEKELNLKVTEIKASR